SWTMCIRCKSQMRKESTKQSCSIVRSHQPRVVLTPSIPVGAAEVEVWLTSALTCTWGGPVERPRRWPRCQVQRLVSPGTSCDLAWGACAELAAQWRGDERVRWLPVTKRLVRHR